MAGDASAGHVGSVVAASDSVEDDIDIVGIVRIGPHWDKACMWGAQTNLSQVCACGLATTCSCPTLLRYC